MQRSLSNQNPLKSLLLLVLFGIYCAIASIYLVMPPLLAILFYYFIKLYDKKDLTSFLYILLFLLIYEASYGYLTLSLLIYFLLLYYLMVPTLKKIFTCKVCIIFLHVVFVYLGFWLYSTILSTIFWLPIPPIDFYTLFYIMIEFLVLVLL
jgi:hypothetical protein